MSASVTVATPAPVSAESTATEPVPVQYSIPRTLPTSVVVAIGVLGAIDMVLLVWGLAVIA